MCELKLIKGDLFVLSEESSDLAHCVSEDMVMGKGIAVQFKRRYNKISHLKNQNKKSGEVAFLRVAKEKFVYYLVTKKKARDLPQLENLEKSLQAMKILMEENERFHLSIPKIGCGLDRLEWTDVEEILKKIFDSRFRIDVFYL